MFSRKHIKEKLLPDREYDELVLRFGEVVRPMLEELLNAKADAVATRYERAWSKWIDNLNASVVRENEDLLVTRDKAAKMLGISLSSIKRLEERGELPQPHKFGERTVRHRLTDILAFAKSMPTRS
jgi:predicted DNA-binding transcriptional regulator AlpA